MTPELWHFPISHYNEKVRWALDWKGIAHRRIALGLGYMLRAWRATGTAKLPILKLGDQTVGDSTHIIAELERRYPERPLYPSDPELRRRALDLEDYFDEVVGDPVRSLLVGNLVRRDPRDAIDALATSMPDVARAAHAVRPLFRVFYYWRHSIDDEAIDAAPAIIEASFDHIDEQRAGRDYLAGDEFSVADLTAAAIHGPLLRPPELQYPPAGTLPEPVEALRERLTKHPTWEWLRQIWQRHRSPSAEIR